MPLRGAAASRSDAVKTARDGSGRWKLADGEAASGRHVTMDRRKWTVVLLAVGFLGVGALYVYTCLLKRKHGLSSPGASPGWINLLYDAALSRDLLAPAGNVYDLGADPDPDVEPCVRVAPLGGVFVCPYAGDGGGRPVVVKRDVIDVIRRRLADDGSMGFVDVGSKLGVYSLLAAKLGHRVLSVEPSLDNARRFHKAIRMSQLADNVTLLVNAVGDVHGVGELFYDRTVAGAVTILRIQPTLGGSYVDEAAYARFVTLDDLSAFCHFDAAVVRIAVEGFEPSSFAASGRLFRAVHVPLIVMEWSPLARRDSDAVGRMIDHLTGNGYQPKSLRQRRLDVNAPETWPYDVMWVKDTDDE